MEKQQQLAERHQRIKCCDKCVIEQFQTLLTRRICTDTSYLFDCCMFVIKRQGLSGIFFNACRTAYILHLLGLSPLEGHPEGPYIISSLPVRQPRRYFNIFSEQTEHHTGLSKGVCGRVLLQCFFEMAPWRVSECACSCVWIQTQLL